MTDPGPGLPSAVPRRRIRRAPPRAIQLRRSAGAVALIATLLSGCGPAANPATTPTATQRPAPETYGALPSWLAGATGQSDAVLTGTADRPALTAEGDAVRARFGSASVLVRVAGPVVPGEGLPHQGPTTTCTWTVTLTDAVGLVPIEVADFTARDHLAAMYKPTLVAGQPAPPAVLAPGRSVTFELRTVMRTGEGLMRWAPGGKQLVASWDFEVETD